MPHEQQGAYLLELLRERWGDEPGWTLRPNKNYGFYLLYRHDLVPTGEVRKLIEATFGFAPEATFIIGALLGDTSPT